jgi:NADH-quinone oxidoreductase subunit C
MDAATIVSSLKAALPGVTIDVAPATDRPTLVVSRAHLLDACRALRDLPDLGFVVLTDLTAVDFWPDEPRFALIYHLLSPDRGALLRLKVRVGGGDEAHVPTAEGIWPSAGWLEREVWDMFGIAFDGHPDLRRLLMPEDWEGHPLRKDYPVQIRMAPKVLEPLQMSPEEFLAKLEADRHVRADRGGAADPAGPQGGGERSGE